MVDYIPESDPDFIAWQANFINKLTTNSAQWALGAADTSPVTTAQTSWKAAHPPDDSTKYRDLYVGEIHVLVRRLKASPHVSASALIDLGVALPKGDDEGAIAKYQSYDEWSRHFSAVRMTVVPFGVTTSIAILAWGWDRVETMPLTQRVTSHGLPLFPALAMVVWLATIVLMVWLTYQTYRWGRRMLIQAAKAGINNSRNEEAVARKMLRDPPLWAIVFALVCIFVAYGRQLYQFDGRPQPTNVRIIPAGY